MVKQLPALLQRLDIRNARSLPRPDKVADPFYSSPEFRRWRRAVMVRAHWQCESASHPPDRPRRGNGIRLYADHIRERKDSPQLALDPDNGQCLCAVCHSAKTWAEKRRREGKAD